MTKKEYLSRYFYAKKLAESKKDEIEQLETLAQYISPQPQSGGGKGTDKVGRLAAKIADKQRDLETQIEELMHLRKDIERTISAVNNSKYKLLLNLRYINCFTFEQIADKMNVSPRWIFKLHKKALNAVTLPKNFE